MRDTLSYQKTPFSNHFAQQSAVSELGDEIYSKPDILGRFYRQSGHGTACGERSRATA
jgi:hypothetical protein